MRVIFTTPACTRFLSAPLLVVEHARARVVSASRRDPPFRPKSSRSDLARNNDTPESSRQQCHSSGPGEITSLLGDNKFRSGGLSREKRRFLAARRQISARSARQRSRVARKTTSEMLFPGFFLKSCCHFRWRVRDSAAIKVRAVGDFIGRGQDRRASARYLSFSIFLAQQSPSTTASRVSVNTTNPPAIKHRRDRARCRFCLFSRSLLPPPFFVPLPLFHSRRPSRSPLSPPLPLFPSFYFCETSAREQSVRIVPALVQQRIINYSRHCVCVCARARMHSCSRLWQNSARSTIKSHPGLR